MIHIWYEDFSGKVQVRSFPQAEWLCQQPVWSDCNFLRTTLGSLQLVDVALQGALSTGKLSECTALFGCGGCSDNSRCDVCVNGAWGVTLVSDLLDYSYMVRGFFGKSAGQIISPGRVALPATRVE